MHQFRYFFRLAPAQKHSEQRVAVVCIDIPCDEISGDIRAVIRRDNADNALDILIRAVQLEVHLRYGRAHAHGNQIDLFALPLFFDHCDKFAQQTGIFVRPAEDIIREEIKILFADNIGERIEGHHLIYVSLLACGAFADGTIIADNLGSDFSHGVGRAAERFEHRAHSPVERRSKAAVAPKKHHPRGGRGDRLDECVYIGIERPEIADLFAVFVRLYDLRLPYARYYYARTVSVR